MKIPGRSLTTAERAARDAKILAYWNADPEVTVGECAARFACGHGLIHAAIERARATGATVRPSRAEARTKAEQRLMRTGRA